MRKHKKVKYIEKTCRTKSRDKRQLEENKQWKKSKRKLKQNKVDVEVMETAFNNNFLSFETEVNAESVNEKMMKGGKYMVSSNVHKHRTKVNPHETDIKMCCFCCKVIFTNKLYQKLLYLGLVFSQSDL